MKPALLAGLLLATLVTGAAASLAPRPVAVYVGAPDRPFVVLGEVSVLSDGHALDTAAARALAGAARQAHGRTLSALITPKALRLPTDSLTEWRATAVEWR